MRSVVREKNVDGVIVLSVERSLKGTREISLRERIDELVRVCNVSQRILSLLKITHLDTVLDLYSTEEQALNAFGQANGE